MRGWGEKGRGCGPGGGAREGGRQLLRSPAAKDGRCGVAGGERGAERRRVQCVRAKGRSEVSPVSPLSCALPGHWL